jgi:transposase
MQDAIFIGIDVSLRNNTVFLMDNQGNRLERFSVHNDRSGAGKLVQRIATRYQQQPQTHFVFGLEATSSYGHTLLHYLHDDTSVPSGSKTVYQLNPRQVHQFKDFYNDIPKDDGFDAFVIADSLRFGRLNNREPFMDEKYKALQALTRARFHVAQELAREKNRYLNHLFLRFSVMAQQNLFANNTGATAIALLDDFASIDEIAEKPVEELAAYLNEKGKKHFADPVALAKEIQQAARNSYRLPAMVEGSVRQVMALSVQTIRFHQHQLKQYNKAIAQLMKSIPNTLTSIKGIGPVYAAGILAEIGEITRFKDQAALAKYAGLVWSKHQSGSFEADQTHLIRSGNRYLRYYLIEAANLVRMYDPEMKRYYQVKYREVTKTPHKRAVALTARKLIRLVYALLRDNRLYCPPKVD